MGVTFKYLLLFELILVSGVKIAVQLHFSACGYRVFPPPFVANTALASGGLTASPVKRYLTVSVRVSFWPLNLIPLFCVCIFMTVPHCFDCCSFVI